MSYAATAPRSVDFRAIVEAVAPGPVRRDPLGIVTGFRAHRVYTALAAKSDRELDAMGLTRADLPRVAMAAVSEG